MQIKNNRTWLLAVILISAIGILVSYFVFMNLNNPFERDTKTIKNYGRQSQRIEQTFNDEMDQSVSSMGQPSEVPADLKSDLEPSGFFNTIWGIDKEHIFIGGNDGKTIQYSNGKVKQINNSYPNRIRKIRGISSTEVYAGCDDGLILKYNGTEWEKFAVLPGKIRIFALQAFKKKDKTFLAAGGDYGAAYIYDGSEWKKTETGTQARIWNFYGFSPDDFYAITFDTLLHYDGKVWKKIPLPDNHVYYYCITGTSNKDIYLAGEGGKIFHYNGKSWEELTKFTGIQLNKDFIWCAQCSNPDNIYFLTYKGKIIIWTPSAKTAKCYDTNQFQSEIWSDKDGFFITTGGDGTLFTGDEKNGIERLRYGNPRKGPIAAEPENIPGINSKNKPIITKGPNGWEPVNLEEKDLVSVWGVAPKNYYAVGNAGRVFHLDNSGWKKMSTPTSYSLYSIRGIDTQHIYTCGVMGTFMVSDGTKWQLIPTGITEDLSALSCLSTNCVYICGFKGTLLKYDGTKTEKIELPDRFRKYNFSDIWAFSENDLYVIGDQGVILHITGNSVHQIETDTTKWLLCMWAADKNKIFIGVEDGIILLLSDGTIKRMDAGIPMCIFGLWGTSDNNVYGVSGDGGKIIHFDGKTWKPIAVADDYLCDIWGTNDKNIIAVGAGKN
ncbi:MAG: WD40 repeat domain-containing protein [Firmicutes bacterium]|nr:WD40 repeat domain-containing protein [Bacillota bacterium]